MTRLIPLAAVACAFVAGCSTHDAELAALRAENAALRNRLAATADEPPSEELATDLEIENRRLEALAGVTAKGELVESETARFREAFDPVTGRTTVLSGRLPVESTAAIDLTRYALAVGYTHEGKRLAGADRPVPSLLLLLETGGNRSTRLAAAESATLTADGVLYTIPLGSHAVLRERRTGGAGGRARSANAPPALDERLLFTLDRPTARALARSAEATLELPGLTLTLTRGHAALARAALLRSE